jgi:hypothetical protein
MSFPRPFEVIMRRTTGKADAVVYVPDDAVVPCPFVRTGAQKPWLIRIFCSALLFVSLPPHVARQEAWRDQKAIRTLVPMSHADPSCASASAPFRIAEQHVHVCP